MSMIWVCDRCGRTEPADDWDHDGPTMPDGWATQHWSAPTRGDYCGDPCWPSYHQSENLLPPVPDYTPTIGLTFGIPTIYQEFMRDALAHPMPFEGIRVALHTSNSPRPSDEPT